jgi:uncharacterized membrane protein YfcA
MAPGPAGPHITRVFDPLTLLGLAALGVFAGGLTTMAGMGGGILLILTLGVLVGPRFALAATAPALMLGNLHRLFIFREHLDRRVAGSFVLGAFPAALLGGVLAVSVPESWLRGILVAVTLLAVARGLGKVRWTASIRTLAPAGAIAGGVAATSGAAIVVPPILFAAGVRGDAYIATGALTAAAMHLARLLGYGVGGLVTLDTVGASAVVAVALVAGNQLAHPLRRRLREVDKDRLGYGVMVLLVLLAVLGITRS